MIAAESRLRPTAHQHLKLFALCPCAIGRPPANPTHHKPSEGETESSLDSHAAKIAGRFRAKPQIQRVYSPTAL